MSKTSTKCHHCGDPQGFASQKNLVGKDRGESWDDLSHDVRQFISGEWGLRFKRMWRQTNLAGIAHDQLVRQAARQLMQVAKPAWDKSPSHVKSRLAKRFEGDAEPSTLLMDWVLTVQKRGVPNNWANGAGAYALARAVASADAGNAFRKRVAR
jgi:hypothetical protein